MATSPMMRAAQPSQQGAMAQQMRAPAPTPMQAAARPTSMQPAAQPTLGQLDQMRAQQGMVGSMPPAGRMAPTQNSFSAAPTQNNFNAAPQTVQMQGVQLPQGASQQALDQAMAQMQRDKAIAAQQNSFSAAPQAAPQNSFTAAPQTVQMQGVQLPQGASQQALDQAQAQLLQQRGMGSGGLGAGPQAQSPMGFAAPQNSFTSAPQTMPNFNAGPQNTFSASPQARLDQAQAALTKQLNSQIRPAAPAPQTLGQIDQARAQQGMVGSMPRIARAPVRMR